MLAFTVWMVVWFWFCGPHLIGKDWFERGLFNWGYATGTFATGFCLLRVVDPNKPEHRSERYCDLDSL